MKGVFFISVLSFGLLGLMACRTVPQHLVREEVIIYYYEPVLLDIPPIGGPHPPPDLPYTPVTNPNLNTPAPPKNNQTLNPNDGNNYGKRDPIQGGDKRGSEIIKSDPPVRKQEQNDRAQ